MDYFLILVRLVHVFGAVFWVGGVLLLTLFVTPAVAASAETGQKFMQQLMGHTRLSTMLAAAGGSSILAGFILYWIDSAGFTSAWLSSGPGKGFGLGAVFGLIGFAVGIMISRLNKSLAALGGQIQGQPTAEQAAQLAAIRKRVASLAPINTASLMIATVLMAVARYFNF